MSERPTIKPDLHELILRGLRTRYTSESCQDGIQTGNHYQSVLLGDARTEGFRTAREEFLDRIPFAGKKVLDLGSNLGELSRAARARGAAVVDGFESDPFFVELANAINAHNDVTRVSFFERDITDPSVYNEEYDIVLAFSVFTYISGVLDAIARVTREVIVIETHKLDDNLRGYVAPAAKFFPSWKQLGVSEWSSASPAEGTRAVLAFARTPDALERALGGPDRTGAVA
jgi:SAM-dependent methyltransferase